MISKKQLFAGMSLALMTAFIFSACLSELDFDLPENESTNIAIVSQLTDGNPAQIITSVKTVAPFQGFNQEQPILGAQVSLLDENGNTQTLPAVADGLYATLVNDFEVVTGESYQLRVVINGNEYVSEFEKLHAVPKASQITHSPITRNELNDFSNIVENPYLQFFIDTPLTADNSDEKVYLKWDFDTVYRFIETTLGVPFPPTAKVCYYTELLSLDMITVFNGPESRNAVLEGDFLLEEPLDHRFARGFYLNVYQQSLSEGAFQYWNQIRAITDLSGNFFEDPPGQIRSNFQNINNPDEDVFGYFYATQIDTIRVKVESSDYNIPSICPAVSAPGMEGVRSTCFDCLMQPFSTLEKPSFWED